MIEKTSTEVVRKEMGLEWMLKSASKRERDSHQEEEAKVEEVIILNICFTGIALETQ